MDVLKTLFIRGNSIESEHEIICMISSKKENIFLSTKKSHLFYPRSSIKIFQAIPFVSTGAIEKFKLNDKQIALSCASHKSETFHITELKNWISKLNLKITDLQCGIHLPLDRKSSENLLVSKIKPTQLNNNCAGKHLGMLSSCLINNKTIKNYLDFKHYHQKKIRDVFNCFTESEISFNNYSIDGCGAPQYSLRVDKTIRGLKNLIDSYNNKFDYSHETQTLINSILKYPKFIGGNNGIDSNLIKLSKGKFFCKGGAEGVLLFAHLEKNIVGLLKVKDGNERAIPHAMYEICKKFKIFSSNELDEFKYLLNNTIYNHANKVVGKIITEIK